MSGAVFHDADEDGEWDDEEGAVTEVEVRIVAPAGAAKRVLTDEEDGTFVFANIPRGPYEVRFRAPQGFRTTTDRVVEVELPEDADEPVHFGIVEDPTGIGEAEEIEWSLEVFEGDDRAWTALAERVLLEREAAVVAEAAAVVAAESGEVGSAGQVTGADVLAGLADEAGSAEQVAALSRVVSLPLRFAPGRDTLAQVQRRDFGNGTIWLGVPFISQMDGGDFQFVNCGPASLAMVFAAFGLQIGPTEIREYLNWLVGDYDPDNGTSLDSLSTIARQAGLSPIDLYSDRGGYRDWSTEAVRWHVSQGRPVIALVKYRLLPGHGSSISEFDHYVVISGLTPDGFIYNDGAFATTLGYGLEITEEELERAWSNLSIPHHAVALTMSQDVAGLSFPERPREAEEPAPAEEVAPLPVRDAWGSDPENAVAASPQGLADLLSAPEVPAAAEELASVGDAGGEALVPGQVATAPEPPKETELVAGAEMRRMAPQIGLIVGALFAFSLTRSLLAALRVFLAHLARVTAGPRQGVRNAVIAFVGAAR